MSTLPDEEDKKITRGTIQAYFLIKDAAKEAQRSVTDITRDVTDILKKKDCRWKYTEDEHLKHKMPRFRSLYDQVTEHLRSLGLVKPPTPQKDQHVFKEPEPPKQDPAPEIVKTEDPNPKEKQLETITTERKPPSCKKPKKPSVPSKIQTRQGSTKPIPTNDCEAYASDSFFISKEGRQKLAKNCYVKRCQRENRKLRKAIVKMKDNLKRIKRDIRATEDLADIVYSSSDEEDPLE